MPTAGCRTTATRMKLSIERARLLKALNHVQSVVERRNTIPILSNVLMTAEGGSLRLGATDLDMEIVETAEADIERSGQVTAPAHTLYEIVRKLPDGALVRIEHGGGEPRLTVSAGRSRFALPALPAADFPALGAGAFDVSFVLEPAALSRLLDRTRFAISTEETRYYLNGVYLHAARDAAGGPALRAVATDGHRLALAEHPLPEGAERMAGVIVPRKTVQEVRRLLDDAQGLVEVALSDAKIRVAAGGVVLTSKLIDGSFPDYTRVIPKDNPRKLVLDNKAFQDAVDRVATVSAERTRSVKMAVDSERVVLSVTHPETGTATEELPSDFAHDSIEIGFNARYLLDVAQQIGAGRARFEFADSASPTLVCDEGDEHVQYVIMPLRV
jgi:DNA polymerase III subunit beta